MEKKKVVVLIPTLNCADDLRRCLRALEAQTYQDFEILVVDGHSQDDTVKVAKEFGARVVFDDGDTRGHACNTGLRHTNADIVVFTDADTIPRRDWLENLVRHFDNPEVSSVGGPNIAPPDDTYIGKCADVTYGSIIMTGDTRYGKIMDRVVKIYHNPGCNVAYRKSVIEGVGGFEEDLPTAEDLALDHRITSNGHKIYFDPDAVVFHRRRGTIKGYMRQIYRYGLGRAMANIRHPGLKKCLHILPTIGIFLFVALLLVSVASLLLLPQPVSLYPSLLLMILLAIYFSISLFGASHSYSPYAKGMYVVSTPVLIALGHIAWGVGYLKGIREAKRRGIVPEGVGERDVQSRI